MDEYINKQVLLGKLKNELCKIAMPHEVEDRIKETLERFAYSFAIIVVEKENVVDAVEVVRCKDCVHKNPYNRCEFSCKCMRDNMHHNADDYCSYGRKKEVDDSGIHT